MSNSELPQLIETAPGLYEHYKGMRYEVIGTVRHSETLEPMTLYRACMASTACGCDPQPCSMRPW